MSESDLRQQPRAPLKLRVEYQRMNVFFADYTKNISSGGTFIRTASPLPVGTRFVFQLQVPGLDAPVELDGEVAWINTEPLNESGMGVEFVFHSELERMMFESTVEKLMLDSLGPDLSRVLLARTG